MTLTRQLPWFEQPQTAVEVNWENPLSRGLLFLAPLNPTTGLRELVRGHLLTRTGALTPTPSRNGIYPTFAASNYLDLPSVPALGTTGPATFAWTQEPRSTSAYSTLLQINFGSGTNAFLIYQSASDANYQLAVGPAGNGGGNNGSAANFAVGSATNGALDRFVLVAAAGVLNYFTANYSLWKNGVKVAAATSTTFGSTTTAVARIGATNTGSDPFEGLIGNLHIWNRSLTDAEAAAWSSPGGEFSLFAPRVQYLWSSILSGAYTLNAETGVYTFTGSDATLLHNYALTLDSASYSLTGSNATLLKGLILDAASGSYTLTGSNATFVYNKLLNASSGSYSVTGADANLIYTPGSGAYTLNAESGAYVLTGSDVTFSYSGGTVTLKAGSWIRYRIIT